MIKSHAALLVGTTESTGVPVDHIGVVVADLAGEVAAWRQLGFTVSDPVPLMARNADGRAVPLGQSSAHVVFENAYVELSSPMLGCGNHLEPYLVHGDGVRILVVATPDAAAAQAVIAARYPETTPVRSAERTVSIDGGGLTARFLWFPLPYDVLPGVLSAVVQHLTPEFVFHANFVTHANGLRRISRVLARGRRNEVVPPDGLPGALDGVPQLLLVSADEPPSITGVMLTDASSAHEQYFALSPDRPTATSPTP